MKIRLAMLETDKLYLNRMVSVFNTKYADKLEIYSFTEKENALEALRKYHVDVFLAGEFFDIKKSELPDGCGFAWLVETSGIESLHGEAALCKFQKAELIYKQILSIFSEQASAITGMHSGGSNAKLIGFFSAAGGSGSTMAAAACAVNLAQKGKKALYLNLETLGNTDLFFHGDGQGSFEDVIYAVKSRKGNLYLKMESSVRRDATGVYYFSKTTTALEMNELKAEELIRIITELKTSCDYEYVILDLDFSFAKEKLNIFAECSQLVMVSDGSIISNDKALRILQALHILEQQEDRRLTARMGILYNRFIRTASKKLEGWDIPELGVIKHYEERKPEQLVQKLSQLSVFDNLLSED